MPTQDDEPYVLASEVGDETQTFRIVLTTQKLLATVATSKILHIDATYKINWHGYPVIIAGVGDADRQFFPCVISVLSSETTEDYAFVLQALKNGASIHGGIEYQPEVVVADMARAISAAVGEVFPAAVRRVCWFHLKKAAEEKARREPPEARDVFLRDLADLQLSPTEGQFWHAARLMMQKWRDQWPNSAFIDYFEDTVLKENSAFYEGVHKGSPSTNNGLESVNRVVKDVFTIRERLPLGQFFQQMLVIARNWSMDTGTRRRVAIVPTVGHGDLCDGHAFVNSSKVLVDVGHVVLVPAGEATEMDGGAVQAYLEDVMACNATDFDTLMALRKGIWCVHVGDRMQLGDMSCTCRCFLKKGKCKHVVGLGSIWGLVEITAAAKAQPLGQKRKRGRPTRVRPALERQPGEGV